MSELNPHHPVTQSAHDHWHKIVALLMHKFDLGNVVLTPSDLDSLEAKYAGKMPVVVLHDKRDGLHLSIVDMAEAQRLARLAGGLPS